MNPLEQRRTKNGQIFPAPHLGEVLEETPPTFRWLREDVETYTVLVRDAAGNPVWQGETARTYVTPERVLEPGEYAWNLMGDGRERGWIPFSISRTAVRFLRPDARTVLDAVPERRPRALFFQEDVPQLLRERPWAVETLRRNVAEALAAQLPEPPRFHRDPEALPYREYFGRHRDYCDRDLVACALAWGLYRDEAAGSRGVALFLTLCDWNSEGPCSLEGIWGDEIGLSHARCFPAVFDLLYDRLTPEQRRFAARVVGLYAAQCQRMLERLDFTQNPGNSHAGRLPAYLGEAAMVLKGTDAVGEETLLRWLTQALEIYGGMFPYFGGSDGSWAEGMFYASSYTKWYLPFFSAVERYTGVCYLSRPFYRHFPVFLQHFCPPGWEIHPFGDGYWCNSEDPEWPGFFAQNPYHLYAERYGSQLVRQWSRRAQRQALFRLHLLDVFLPEGEPQETPAVTRAACFPDGGFVSLHTDPAHPERELAAVARCSPFGSVSHEHADQGSFALLAGGTALISPSGYFGRQFGTRHHLEWTNQTVAHNTLLVNGAGQKSFSYEAVGRVLYARDEGQRLTAGLEPAQAYAGVASWTRTLTLTEAGLLVEDRVTLQEPGVLTFLLHALSRPERAAEGLTVTRNGWRLTILPEAGLLPQAEVTDRYAVELNQGEPEAYAVTMPPQYHMAWRTPCAGEHLLRMRLSVTRL